MSGGGGRSVSAGDDEEFDLRTIEERTIARAMAAAGGDVRKAARLLNIGYGALRYRLGRKESEGE